MSPCTHSLLLSLLLIICVSCQTQNEEKMDSRVRLVRNDKDKKVDVLIDGKIFTSYIYSDNIKKPVLYPLVTPQGTKVTRKYPMEASVGERVDHPHHVGLWLNYGDVNGLDFWNNSDSIAEDKRGGYGMIVHNKVLKIEGGDKGRLEVEMDWISPEQDTLLKEKTTFIFGFDSGIYSIDRITKLIALEEVSFTDNKEGMLGIRVARELEHPSDRPAIFTDVNGLPTMIENTDNTGVNGKYINSNGIEGTDCWGKRADWVNLTSTIGDENISLVILDHQSNVGYPTYWHARGYGLFAANPLGQAALSGGKDTLNFKLVKGDSVTFRHRILVASKSLDKEFLDREFTQFSNNY